MTRQLMGTMETIAGRPVLRFERRLAHPPEKVWKAITDPAEMAHWFPARVQTELKVGAPIRFKMEEIDDTFGEVVEVDPPKLFVFRWDGDMLRWEIVPDGTGSRLVFTHTLSGSSTWGDARRGAQHAAGWDGCLDLLVGRLDGTDIDSSTDAWFERNEAYVEEFGLAEGEVEDHPDGHLIRFDRVLVQPTDAMWATLTTGPALTGASGAPGSGPETGSGSNGGGRGHGTDTGVGRVTVGAAPPPRATSLRATPGEVTAVEPDRVLEYAWLHTGDQAGHVRWELSPLDFGCRLALTQTVPGRLGELLPDLLATWQVHLEELIATLHEVTRPWPADRVTTLRRMYAKRLT